MEQRISKQAAESIRRIPSIPPSTSIAAKNGSAAKLLMPPLRERTEDIPLLIDHFCRQFSQAFDKRITGVSDEVMRLCMEYAWLGNVRELEHALEHGALLCPGGKIALEHLPKEFLAPSKELGFRGQNGSIKIDRQSLIDALNATEGNKAAAARRLGISRRTIYRKLQALGLLEEEGV